ncbi:MAG: NfeD family protein [Pirellulales bacterium]
MRLGSALARSVAAISALSGLLAVAGEATMPPTIVVPVRLPLTGTRDTQVEAAVLRRLEMLRGGGEERGVLVLRFESVDGEHAASSDFGRAVELARFLTDRRLAGVRTVAWLPEGVAGHAVLVALACDELAMAPDAVLGPANADETSIDESMRSVYAQIAARRRTVPPEVAVALLDPAARVVRASTDEGERFVAAGDLDELRQRATVLAVEDLEPVPLAIDGRRGRELGLVRILAASSADLARGLGVEERGLAADPSLAGGWKPVRVSLTGGVTAETVARLRGRIERALAEGCTFVWLRIDSAGGSPQQSLVLANWLAGLDPNEVRTVAHVPREARGDAALVAAACDDIVMHPTAVLGGEGSAAIGGRTADAVVAAWRGGVAKLRDRPWSLPAALAVPGLDVHRAVEQGSGRVAYFTEAELESRDDRDAWQIGGSIGVGPLELDGRRAEELGLVAHLVDDAEGVRRAYGLEGEIAMAESGWADRLLEALASPSLAWLLLLIGAAGLFIELKTPGVGFGGFVSMVAFIVYFWSQYLNGTSGWLEVMLFIAGVVCVAAEIFVLPGFGVLGLGGGLLVIAAIVLASQSFVLPVNDYQIRQMQWSLLGILAAVGGVTLLGGLLRRWLPSTPLVRDVLLEPPAATGFDEARLSGLVGQGGTTTTRLAPAGKARIADVIHEVVSDGPLIEPGVSVEVVAVRGDRVIVRAVTAA